MGYSSSLFNRTGGTVLHIYKPYLNLTTWSPSLTANVRINPRRAPATIYDVRKHDEKHAIEMRGIKRVVRSGMKDKSCFLCLPDIEKLEVSVLLPVNSHFSSHSSGRSRTGKNMGLGLMPIGG
jgi:hypothetical protein